MILCRWEKHGTCFSGSLVTAAAKSTAAVVTAQSTYFNYMAELFTKFPTPSLLQTAANNKASLTVAQLQNVFGGQYDAGCVSRHSYTAARCGLRSACLQLRQERQSFPEHGFNLCRQRRERRSNEASEVP